MGDGGRKGWLRLSDWKGRESKVTGGDGGCDG